MSTKAVIIALIVALALGIGAYLVIQPGSKPKVKPGLIGRDELVCAIDPASVSEVEIELAGGERQTVRRGTGGAWTLQIGRQTPPVTWPLEDGRVPSLLRVLSGVRGLDTPEDKAEVDAEAMRVTIREGAKATHLLLSGRTLTGRGLVKVVDGAGLDQASLSELRTRAGKLAVVSDAIHRSFTQPGPKGWRDATALRGVGPDVARIMMVNNELGLKLGRVEAKWAVQEPVAAPADAAQVGRLIGTLGTMKIVSYFDDRQPEAGATGLSTPIAALRCETDRRVVGADPGKPGDVSVKTEVGELLIGNTFDASTRYAQLGKGGPVVTIASAGLARELFEAAGYISKQAVQTPAGDIGMLVIERTAGDTAGDAAKPAGPPTPSQAQIFRRDLDKWKQVSGASEVSLDQVMTKAVTDLLAFLTTERAASVALGPPQVWKEEAHLEVGSLAGTPLETIVVGTTDGGGQLVIRAGGSESGKGSVYRLYPRERVPAILAALLPAAKEQVKVPEGTREITK